MMKNEAVENIKNKNCEENTTIKMPKISKHSDENKK